MRSVLVIAMIVAGCGNHDDCERMADKVIPVIKEIGERGHHVDRDAVIGECRRDQGRVESQSMKCLQRAEDHDAVKACLNAARATEATVHLQGLQRHLKMAVVTGTGFPVGKAAMTPEKDCCKGPDQHCPVAAWASDPIWAALEFQIDEPTMFQYGYDSDGTHVTVTAVADLDCDNHAVTYKLEGTSDGGDVAFHLVGPGLEVADTRGR